MSNEALSSKLRKLLRGNPDGLLCSTLADTVGATYEGINRSLKTMPDTYIKQYVLLESCHRYAALWAIVIPPADAVHPNPTGKRGFKPIDPNWLDKQQAKKTKPAYVPQKTFWQPVAPWPKETA